MRLLPKQLLASVLPLVGAAVIFTAVYGYVAHGALETQAQRIARLELLRQSREIEHFFSERIHALYALADSPAIRSGDLARVRLALLGAEARTDEVEGYYFVDLRGNVHPTRGGSFSIRDRDYFPALVDGKTLVTNVLASRDTGHPIAAIMVPVHDDEGQRIGALGAAVPVTQVLARVRALSPDAGSFGMLIDEADHLVRSGALEPAPVSLEPLLDRLRGEGSGVLRLEDEGRSYFAYYETLEVPHWKLLLVYPESVMFAEVARLRALSASVLVLSLLFAILLAFAVSRGLVNPIRALIDAQRRLGEGDLGARADDSTPGELGELAATFNRTADRLDELLGDRQRAEDALRESERRYRNLVEHSPLPIFVHREGKFVFANPAMLALLGTRDEGRVLGHPIDEFVPSDVHTPVAGVDLDPDDSTYAGYARGEATLIRVDGARVAVESVGISLPFDGGVARLVIMQDIGERLRAEEERRRFEAQVQHAQKLESLGVLAGGIAHDFNNMLAAILGNAEIALEESDPGSEAATCIEHIKIASIRAAELTNQMLAYSGKARFHVRSLDLNVLVKEMGALLEVSVSQKGALQYDLSEDPTPIMADSAQVRQVVMNLITNASEALDQRGTITLHTRAVSLSHHAIDALDPPASIPPGRYVCLSVRDDGCGMNGETRAKIFEPFFTTKFTGRGLGLAAVQGIIRGHKGAITVESREGSGTTVRAYFPLHVAEPARARAATPAARATGHGQVLVADDEPEVLEVARRMLERAGYEVITATNGREAVELYSKHRATVRCVLLDLTMPELSGDEALEELRAIDSSVRVILVSGFDVVDAESRFQGRGTAAFLQKPFRVEALLDVVKRVSSAPA